MSKNIERSARKSAMLLCTVFLVPSVLWIVLSDMAVFSLFPDAQQLTEFQTIKGWFYVIVIGILLYSFSYRVYEKQFKREQELRESEEHNRLLLEHAGLGIGYYDPTGKCLLLNRKACEYMQEDPQNLIGKHVSELFGAEQGAVFMSRIRDVVTKKEVQVFEDEVDLHGKMHWFSSTYAPIKDNNGGISGIQIISTDMTDHKKAENALRESEARWQFALEGAGDGVWDWDVKNDRVLYSRQWKKMLGYEDYEIGSSLNEWDKRVHPDDKKEVHTEINRHLKGETTHYSSEHRVQCKDGSYKWILDRGKIIERDKEGNPVRMIGTHADITERKDAEAAYYASERRFKMMFNHATFGIVMCRLIRDEKGKAVDYLHLQVNDALERHVGIKPADVLGKLGSQVISGEETHHLVNKFSTAIETGIPYEYQQYLATFDKTIDMQAIPIEEDYFAVVFFDITERKKAEKKLKESEERFQKAFHSSPIGINMFTLKDARSIDVNNAFLQIVGYSREEFIGRTADELELILNTEERKVWLEKLKKNEPLYNYETLMRHKSGEIRNVLASLVITQIKGEKVVVLVADDVTEQKRIEQQLKLSEEKYRRIVETAREGIWIIDKDSVTTFVNQSMADMLGYKPEEMNGQLLYTFMTEKSIDAAKNNVQRRKAGLAEQHEFQFKKKDGTTIWTLLNTTPVLDTDLKYAGQLAMVSDITNLKKTMADLENSQSELRALALHIDKILEDERMLLSREIHDELGQLLTLFKLKLSLVEEDINNVKDLKARENILTEFDNLNTLIDKAVKNINILLARLRPEVLENIGLLASIDAQVSDFMKNTGIAVTLDIPDSEIKLDQEKELAIFRIIQEALTNIARHAKATEVKIDFKQSANRIFISIVDNGVGIKAHKQSAKINYGLIGMRERAYSIGGQIKIESDENGTAVYLEIKIK